MAATSRALAEAQLRLVLNGTPIPGIADDAATTPLTTLYVSIHATDPQYAADQSVGEVSYPGYARVAVARNAGGWTVVGATASPSAAIVFPAATGGPPGVAYFAEVGTGASGPSGTLYSGPLAPPIPFGPGVTPRIETTSKILG